MYLIGHSLGGHCIGLIARYLKTNSNYVIPRLYGLDPAGPGFEEENFLTELLKWLTFSQTDFQMISKDDAEYVQIIHTNAGKYGIMRSRGHADFFPNSGHKQNGCELGYLDDVCSHRHAWVYYQESVYPRRPFWAVKCDSFENFRAGKCKNNTKTFMGLSDKKDEGNFYLITHSNPLSTSLGKDGIEYKNEIIITEDGKTEKPLLMNDGNLNETRQKLKWENDVEFEKLFIESENGEIEKNFVKLKSPLELMGHDFEVIESSSGKALSAFDFSWKLIFLSVFYSFYINYSK